MLAEIYARRAQGQGLRRLRRSSTSASREAIFPALERGDLTVVPEYTGALLSYVTQGASATRKEIDAQVTELKANLPAKLTLLEPSAAEDKDTITCNKETVDKYGLTSIEDLAKVGDQITMGGPPEFAKRDGFGIKALKRVYGASSRSSSRSTSPAR